MHFVFHSKLCCESEALAAAGMLRADCLGATLCTQGPAAAQAAIARLERAQAAVGSSQLIALQSMFSVLVHAPPVFRGCAACLHCPTWHFCTSNCVAITSARQPR